MKPSVLLSTLLLATAVGALVVTNPTPDAYEAYASQKANIYLSEEICKELPDGLIDLVQGQCTEVVKAIQPELATLIRDRTQRLNLGIASIYRTSLGIQELPMIPRYEVETLGIVGRFITYRAARLP